MQHNQDEWQPGSASSSAEWTRAGTVEWTRRTQSLRCNHCRSGLWWTWAPWPPDLKIENHFIKKYFQKNSKKVFKHYSRPELMGWTSFSVSLNNFQGTIVLSPKLVLQNSAASLLVILNVSPANVPWEIQSHVSAQCRVVLPEETLPWVHWACDWRPGWAWSGCGGSESSHQTTSPSPPWTAWWPACTSAAGSRWRSWSTRSSLTSPTCPANLIVAMAFLMC